MTATTNTNSALPSESYGSTIARKISGLLQNRNARLVAGGTALGTLFGKILGPAALDTFIRAGCTQCMGSIAGKIVGSIAAPAITNYLGNTVVALGGGSGILTVYIVYYTGYGIYYLITKSTPGSGDPQLPDLKDLTFEGELDSSQSESTDCGDFVVLEKPQNALQSALVP
jgi:hypothetical protein